MLWAFLSIFSGLGDATVYAAMKKVKGVNRYTILFSRYAIALVFLSFMLFFEKIPAISDGFFPVLFLNSFILAIGSYFIIRATQISPLSTSIPMLSFTPVFLILTSYLMLKEIPSFMGIIGIFLIVIGAYTLNIHEYKKSFFEPFRALLKEKGTVMVLAVAFLYSISANLGKLGILYSDAVFFSFACYLVVVLFLFPLLFIKPIKKLHNIRKNLKYLLIMGIAAGIMMVASAIALKMAIVPYVISLKRFSVIFSVLFGYFLFKEEKIKERLIGAIIMLLGASLIILF